MQYSKKDGDPKWNRSSLFQTISNNIVVTMTSHIVTVILFYTKLGIHYDVHTTMSTLGRIDYQALLSKVSMALVNYSYS